MSAASRPVILAYGGSDLAKAVIAEAARQPTPECPSSQRTLGRLPQVGSMPRGGNMLNVSVFQLTEAAKLTVDGHNVGRPLDAVIGLEVKGP
jgi:hypothetical protein